ncbi:MAG: TniQ family protein [Gallionella sp.]|nr:TniQ family protein [Gallionella sp.]
MPIWATHPKPKEDELLSSWLIRIASECGMSATKFCSEVLYIKKPNLRVADRSPDDLLLQGLSEGTGVPVERIRETSLLAEEGYVFSQSGKGISRWIIPAITVNTKINDYTAGMAYCPECLRTDKTPYYRKNWRYAYYAICTKHRIPLRSICPHCSRPYSHMQPVNQKSINITDPIRTCWSCGGDVSIMQQSPSWGGNLLDMALSIQENILAGINRGAFDIPDQGYVNSRAYLDVFYSVARSLVAWIESTDRMKCVGKMSGIEFAPYQAKPLKPSKDADIENWQAADRAIILCLANWLMGEWPTRLVAYAEKSKLNYGTLFESIDESYWLSAVPVPVSSRQPAIDTHSNEEIINATQILRKLMGRAVSTYEVQEFMTEGTIYNKIQKQIAAKKSAREWHQKFVQEWERDLQAAKNKRLSKIITWSKSRKPMAKIDSDKEKTKSKHKQDQQPTQADISE